MPNDGLSGAFDRKEQSYRASFDDTEGFWRQQAGRLDWMRPFTTVKETSFAYEDLSIKWFADGTLNVSANCIDRHLATKAQQTAILWEPDDPHEAARHISYGQLHAEVSRLGNVLKSHGVQAGDRVAIYMPMIPEAAYAMLAAARIGAIHTVVFAGFSPEAFADRLRDCDPKVILTAEVARRGGKAVPMKANVEEALQILGRDIACLVLRDAQPAGPWTEGRDHDLRAAMDQADPHCPPVEMPAEAPLFILYTSGSTGKPKGVVHSSGGYLLYAALTHQTSFDHQEGDIFWCTADLGWITGHSYSLYAPLANGGTTLLFEGVPTYPDAGRFWQVCAKHRVTQFYTAPTAIRALMALGDDWIAPHDLSHLRVLGSVGEPINPEAWLWYHRVVGAERCPIVDTYWQTETGGHLILPPPHGQATPKPGAACRPAFGIRAEVLDPLTGQPCAGLRAEGALCIADSWPGQMRTLWGDHDRFRETYFSQYRGYYFTGDGCRRDEDGDYWITGRLDDVINVSGHRLGTAEIESALGADPRVAEAAVVGIAHPIKGQGLYAFVTLKAGVAPEVAVRDELSALVRQKIGPIAKPEAIQWAPGLPKTRSGKILRRILRKIAEGETETLGDISTLADPSVVANLIANRQSA